MLALALPASALISPYPPMSDLVSSLESILAADQILAWEAASLPVDLRDLLKSGEMPSAIAYPQTQEQLAAVVAQAYQNRWRVLPCGQGSKLTWGGLLAGADVVISTARLNRVVDHAVGDLTITAEAGLTFAQLQPLLQAENQFLAIDPAYPDRATLGGIVATADAGSLRQRYGSIRDMLIGITCVRYDGQLVKAGGRVVKNVAGYDLMKLMTGAYGSLGMISQVTFRTYPLQPASQTVVFSGGDEILKTLALSLRMSSLTPVALDWLSPALMRDLGQADAFGLVARFQSATAGVTEQVQRLLELGQTLGLLGQVLDAAEDLDWWQRLRPLLTPAPATTDGILAKVGVLPAEASQFLRMLDTLTDVQGKACLHAGSGLGLVSLAALGEVRDILLKLRTHCEATQGYLTLLQAPASIKQAMDVWGYTGNALGVMQRLKQQFDPAQLLSPGRFVAG